MRVLLVFSALLCLVTCQAPSCSTCNDQMTRETRTGCRMFCYFDYFNIGYVTKNILRARLEADKDTDGGMTLDRFQEKIRGEVQLCSGEAANIFNLLTDLGEGDPSLIQQSDVDALADLFEFLTGSSVMYMSDFLELYTLLYESIRNDDCETGF